MRAAILGFLAVAFLALFGLVDVKGDARGATVARPLPPLPSEPGVWINSAPLRVADLAGDVVLVDVWTFECWNCYRSFPWLHALEKRMAGKRFRVLGVHSPEFEREKVRASIEAKAREFAFAAPIVIDNDLAYWRALGNRYWPAFYLVDKRGTIRATYVGETHEGDAQAKAIEAEIDALLGE